MADQTPAGGSAPKRVSPAPSNWRKVPFIRVAQCFPAAGGGCPGPAVREA